MRRRSKTSIATQRSRRGSLRSSGRRQTTLRAQSTRTGARRSRSRGRSTTSRRGKRTGTSSIAHITTDDETIRRWVESRGGWPATVARTARGGDAGVLRIDFPGYAGEGSLKPISWDEWFEKFDENNLAFLYQERTADGKTSRFFKLIERE